MYQGGSLNEATNEEYSPESDVDFVIQPLSWESFL